MDKLKCSYLLFGVPDIVGKKGSIMGFPEELCANSMKLYSVYDLAAFCYDYLVRNIQDQELFIGRYVLTNKNSGSVNPNLDRLNRFNEQIKNQLLENDSDSRHPGLPFNECVCNIVRETEQAASELQRFLEDDLQNEAVISLYILYAIDRYLQESKQQKMHQGPQNVSYHEKSYIYPVPEHNILDEAAMELGFPHEIQPMTVRNQLRNLLILESGEVEDGTEPPDFVSLWVSQNDTCRRSLPVKKKLKFAVIPFEKEHMTKFPMAEGGTFQVEYEEPHKMNGTAKALALLDLAISQNVNVVLFPEFVCYPQLQEDIRKHLREKHQENPESMKNLLFVVAGSGWTKNNNNVARVYSYNGRLLGKQYKYIKFNKMEKNREGMVEGLENPGLKSLICHIDGIGQFMFAICRDVSERGHTRKLAEIFRPQFLLVPAWSASVQNGFQEQFCEIVAQNHRTCSVLCNCCEAFGTENESKEVNGIVVTPYIENRLVKGKPDSFPRSTECWKDGACGGCMFILNLQFHKKAVRQQKIVKGIQMKRLKPC